MAAGCKCGLYMRKSKRSAMMLGLVLILVVMQSELVGKCKAQGCSAELSNLNVCAPFVVPGSPTTNPSTDCCAALQSVENDCLCNTLRVMARLPSQCNLPPMSCGN